MSNVPIAALIEALRSHAEVYYGRSTNGLGDVLAQAADALSVLAPVQLTGPRYLADNGLDVMAMPQDPVIVITDEQDRFLLVERHEIGGGVVIGRLTHFDDAHRCALTLSRERERSKNESEKGLDMIEGADD